METNDQTQILTLCVNGTRRKKADEHRRITTLVMCLHKYYFNHFTDLKWPHDETYPRNTNDIYWAQSKIDRAAPEERIIVTFFILFVKEKKQGWHSTISYGIFFKNRSEIQPLPSFVWHIGLTQHDYHAFSTSDWRHFTGICVRTAGVQIWYWLKTSFLIILIDQQRRKFLHQCRFSSVDQ